ncbi:MAG TPA: YCF48-related protein [Puia sp.]|nr:YCF48-related protein [Puia sp.]
MRTYLIQSSILSSFILLFSCSKSNNNGSAPVTPTPAPKVDSLFSWQKITTESSLQGINDIWFTSAAKGNYAAAGGNIYQSLDSGKSWSKNPNSSSAIMDNLFFVDNNYGFAQGSTQLQVTQDGGNTWSLQTLPTSNALNIFFSNPSTGYYSDIAAGVYKTVDTGKTWTQVYHPTQTRVGYYAYFLNDNNGYIFAGDGSLSKTADGASSWQQVAQGIAINNSNGPSFNALQFLDSLTGYYSSQNGVLKTTDGGVSWTSVYPTGGFVNVIKFFGVNTGYYKSDSVIYKTTNGGQSWTTSCKLAGDFLTGMYFIDSTTGWACTGKGYVLRLTH